MNIVLYFGFVFFVSFAILSLYGRTTYAISGIEPGYFAFSKINKDDKNRKLYMYTQFIINILASLGCLGIGLYIDKIIDVSKNLSIIISISYIFIIIAISIIYTVKLK